MMKCFLCIFSLFVLKCYALDYTNYVLYREGTGFKIVNSSNDLSLSSDWLIEGTYKNDINKTGFAYIEVKTNPKNTDAQQAYYAGYLEGTVTSDLIYSHWNNIIRYICKGIEAKCAKVHQFVKENTKWIKHNIKKNKYDPYWYHIELFYTQMRGILDGYNANSKEHKLGWTDIVWLNLFADIEDLIDIFTDNITTGNGHCSVLIKILPDNKDIYFGHDTWSSYQSMLRFQKKYILNYKKSINSTQRISGVETTFTGYPGIISSIDDFYLISSGLAITETTNQNYNKALWNSMTPTNCVFESVRSVVANRLADNGATWNKIFGLYNSGTYNNQWMILDYKKFKPGRPPMEGVFWVIEQLPTKIVANDLTNVLIDKGFWSSYNIPYYKEIYELGGYTENFEKYGNWFSHENAPRAKIFKRDQGNVTNMRSFMNLMRSNNYKNDPFAHCQCNPPYSATGAIAARDDLNLVNGTYQYKGQGHRPAGAIDAKITNSSLFLDLQFIAVSGPTTGTNQQLSVFNWSKSDFTETPHQSHPDSWNFKPVLNKWKFGSNKS